jgi:ketosteroid isomerase-like protein
VSGYDPEARARTIDAVVRRLVDALAARDAGTIESLLTDDVVYHFPGRNPLAGSFRGRDQVMGFFRRFPTVLDGPPSIAFHDVLSSEAHGADLATFTASRGGREHTWRAIRIYHLSDDRIAEIFVTIDDQAAFDAFMNA